jgi:opacity protein-like surface antigen
MRIPSRGLAAVALASIVLASPAAAQGRLEHDDFFVGFGAGPGWATLNSDQEDAGTDTGISGHLRFGWTLRDDVLVGFETDGWYDSDENFTNAWGSGMMAAYWYPFAAVPAFVKGGAGWMYVNIAQDPDEFTSSHVAFQLGAGYDVRIASNHAITIVGNWIQGLQAGLSFNDVHVGHVSPTILQLGLAYSLY